MAPTIDTKTCRMWQKIQRLDGTAATYHYGDEGEEKTVTVIVESIDEEAALLYASLTSTSEIGVFTLFPAEIGRLPEKGDWLTVNGVDYVLQPVEGKKYWKWSDTTHTAFIIQGTREDREDQ